MSANVRVKISRSVHPSVTSGMGSKADIGPGTAGCPFLAISRHQIIRLAEQSQARTTCAAALAAHIDVALLVWSPLCMEIALRG